MKLTHDYRRVQANWGTDGDFITPEGKVVHVGENHTVFMMDHPEMFGGEDTPDAMVGQGWVQTRMIGWIFSVKADGGMNQAQLHALQKMVRERCRYSDPHIQILMPDENLYDLSCDELDYIEYPNQIKRRGLSSSRRVRANWGKAGDFITPDGKVIGVGSNHSVFMVENPKIFNGITDPGEIVGEGWIRTRNMSGTFSIDARGGMSQTQLEALQKMVRERYWDSRLRIEVATDDGNGYQFTCNEFDGIKYPGQIKRRGPRF